MTQAERKTQAELGDAKLIERQIAAMQTQLERLEYDEEKAERFAAYGGTTGEAALARFRTINEALRAEFLKELTRLNAAKAALHKALSAIGDEPVRVIMMERYMNGKTWEEIAEDNIYGLSTVYRMHQRGLRAIAAFSG